MFSLNEKQKNMSHWQQWDYFSFLSVPGHKIILSEGYKFWKKNKYVKNCKGGKSLNLE